MKLPAIGLLLFLTVLTTVGQKRPITAQENPIYELELRLLRGDKTALLEIAKFFDSDQKVTELLGYHVLQTVEAKIAKRIVLENCLFTEDEISITDSTSAAQFSDFLKRRKNEIVFSELASAFLITPLDKREVNFEVRAITKARKEELQKSAVALLNLKWVRANNIDLLIKQKNPKSLLLIASQFFKVRNRFNGYYSSEEEFINLLQYLTASEIGVENESGKISWHLDKDYYPQSKLNLLIFFSKLYSRYTWSESNAVFVNSQFEINPIRKEDELFQLLDNGNDSIAINAFIQLTACNPVRVKKLGDEYERANIDYNPNLPTFSYKFLTQLAELTEYCTVNGINFRGTRELQTNISLLKSDLPFTERRALENKLISTLSLNDITALEYWGLINEQSWDLTYSVGRILDMVYSKNWNILVGNKKHLDCYLKKAALFDGLGIIGACNNYLNKFISPPETTVAILNSYQSGDIDVMSQVQKIISLNGEQRQKNNGPILWEGNKNYTVNNVEEQILQLTKSIHDSSEVDKAVSMILSQISYSQIPSALKAIEGYPFQSPWKKYSFLGRDFGFSLAGDFAKREIREEFLKLHISCSEYQLYAFYLDKLKLDYKTVDSKIDYDKIFELLKYDVGVAFVGGGGGKKDNEVYLLVKLLELTFNTTLGFPNKLCNSNNMYACYSDERAKVWMNYLRDNYLLKKEHDEPVSFNWQ